MVTEKLRTDSAECEKSISRASEILKNGGIVAIPTETVYGLAASAYDKNAIEKVFVAKGRPQDNPLIVHICDEEMLFKVAKNIPDAAKKCAERFWPGPLTMIFDRQEGISPTVSAGLPTVAVRMPSHKIALEIIRQSRLPLAAPSANISGSPSPTSPLHVENDLYGKIDAIIFSDECDVGVESTVISFVCNPPKVLRPGAVTVEQLRGIIPDIEIDKNVLTKPNENAVVESPGVKYKHYAPDTDCYLVESDSKTFVELVNLSRDAVAVCFEEESAKINVQKLIYGALYDESTLANKVFSVLRKVDELDIKKAYIHAPSKNGVGLAVYNRLLRACGFKVIKLNNVVGLTGPTGAGKSTISKAAEDFGYKVIDCDKLARIAVEKGSYGLNALVKVFGQDILNDDLTLNRKALAKKAFSTPDNTKLLNKTILPYILELVMLSSDTDNILLDAPTLFESGINSVCKLTIAVLADEKLRLDRIIKRDNIDTNSALLRMNAGKPDEFYIDNADFVIYNNGDNNDCINEFKEIINNISGNSK